MQPLCFVLMPFGRKPDESGRFVEFDAIYAEVIAPAVAAAGLEGIRADEEVVGGTIHKPMFERLLLCEYAIADLSTANPNVYYELGVRHALRPRSTMILFSEGTRLPFDVAPLRGLAYGITADGRPSDPERAKAAILARLHALRDDPGHDSPVFQLVKGLHQQQVDHERTDEIRKSASGMKQFRDDLAAARRDADNPAAAVRRVAAQLGLRGVQDTDAGAVVELFLTYRDVKDHSAMLDLYEMMPRPLQRARMVQEQRGFALNRLGRHDEAAKVLQDALADHGPSSETWALLGRVYKDLSEKAEGAGDRLRARGELKRATEAYLAGFEADWRDPFPGINAMTMMELQEPPDPRRTDILPVVVYAARQRVKQAGANYWDHATLAEAAVLARDMPAAEEALSAAIPLLKAGWHAETTARNLRLIRQRRVKRGESVDGIEDLEGSLAAAAADFSGAE